MESIELDAVLYSVWQKPTIHLPAFGTADNGFVQDQRCTWSGRPQLDKHCFLPGDRTGRCRFTAVRDLLYAGLLARWPVARQAKDIR